MSPRDVTGAGRHGTEMVVGKVSARTSSARRVAAGRRGARPAAGSPKAPTRTANRTGSGGHGMKTGAHGAAGDTGRARPSVGGSTGIVPEPEASPERHLPPRMFLPEASRAPAQRRRRRSPARPSMGITRNAAAPESVSSAQQPRPVLAPLPEGFAGGPAWTGIATVWFPVLWESCRAAAHCGATSAGPFVVHAKSHPSRVVTTTSR